MLVINTFRRQAKLMQRAVRLSMIANKNFSTEATQAKNVDNIPEPTEEEKKKYRDAWGLKYNDEWLKFEKEWEKIAEEKEKSQRAFLDEELDQFQKQQVDLIVSKVLRFNMFEMRYFASQIKDRVQRTSGMNPLKLNMDWPSVKMDSDGTWPPLNPNWFKQQELMAKVGPFIGGFAGGAAGGAPAQGHGAAPAEAKKEEPKKEEVVKTNFDVELTSYDAANKIKLIKEIRELLKLGLKEAKDVVEGAPQWIKKDLKKEDAEALVKKLEPLGAKLKLV